MPDVKKEQERDELHRAIWAIADELRGSVDGWDFKNYVLGTMFYRYISENLTAYINGGERESGNADFEYADMSDADAEEAREGLIEEKGFFILPSELFCNVCARAADDENLNETLERIFRHIEESAKGSASENSFGLIALCSVGPIAAVLLLSLLSSGAPSFQLPDYSAAEPVPHILAGAMADVAKSLVSIVLFFAVLQISVLHLPRTRLYQIGFGILYTFIGLVLFLTAVEMAFMPIGFKIGAQLSAQQPSLIVGLGFLIGMVVVLAEPAVHVLNTQVQEITGGEVSKRQMMTALSIGVGVSIGLSVVRVIFGFSLLYYIIPGYLLSLGLSFFVPRLYTAIAFDSGGVASGPLTSSFSLPMVMGVCVTLQGESSVLDLAFGVVAMVAMTPLITIQSLGFKSVMATRHRQRTAMRHILASEDEDPIIYFE